MLSMYYEEILNIRAIFIFLKTKEMFNIRWKIDNFEFSNGIGKHHGHDENYKETKDRIIKRDATLLCIKQRENYCRWKKVFIHFMVKLILKPEIYNKKYYIYIRWKKLIYNIYSHN